MGAREEILARLHAQARDARPPDPWRSRRDFPDLAARFTEALTAVAGEVLPASDLEEALAHLEALLSALEARRIVVNDEAPLDAIDLRIRFPGYEWLRAGDGVADWRTPCATADVGLSGTDAALAETGTIAVSSGPGRSRLATLLPPVHVALLPASRLTADLFTWAAGRAGALPSNLTLISGPSKTADIEQILAIGVHGPKRFIVILYEDGEEGSARGTA